MKSLLGQTSVKNWSLELDSKGFAWLSLNVNEKSVNVINEKVIKELSDVIQILSGLDSLKGVALLSGKPSGFIYGADIYEFELLKTADDVARSMREVHRIFNSIESLAVPTCVGIDGVAVGGGLELALSFDQLIATAQPKTKLGFPEVNLGILPGWGGSGRAFARTGTQAALDLMLTGQLITSKAAFDISLIDQIVENRDDLKIALDKWLNTQNGKKPKRQALENKANKNAVQAARELYLRRIRKDHTPAPFKIIDHVEKHGADHKAMSAGEIDIFPQLLIGETSGNLRRVFYLSDAVKKTSRGDSGIVNLHVVGAGVMGGDIAAFSALKGLNVSLADMNQRALENALERAQKLFERRLKTEEEISAAMTRLQIDATGESASKADLIIEAVSEKLEVKQTVFSTLEKICGPDTILATNTSAILLEDIASGLAKPEKLIGLHFFNPMPVLPLVEVIWSKTSDQSMVKRGMQYAGKIGKMPIKCKSSEGFLVNRALLPYIYKAMEVLSAGKDADMIDQSLSDFGMPMGPIELADQIGLDVCLDAGHVLGISTVAQRILRSKIESGNIGRKSGQGFYKWEANKAVRPRRKQDPATMEKIVLELLEPMVIECRKAVQEGVVDTADDVDAGMIFGTGFPSFRGGPMTWAKDKF